MKFQIKLELIKKYMKSIASVTPSIAHRPEITGVYIEVYENRVIFESRNELMDTKIETIDLTKINISETGKVLVKARVLNELIQRSKGDYIELIKVDSNLLFVRSNDSEYEINVIDDEKFNKSNFIVTEGTEIEIEANIFRNAINRVIYAANEKAPRKILQSVNLDIRDNILTTIATDGVRIAVNQTNVAINETINKNIHSKTLKDILKLINEDKIKLLFSNTHLVLTTGDFLIQVRLIEGGYPDVMKVFPVTFNYELSIEKDLLVDLIERSTLLSSNKIDDNLFVKMIVIDNNLKFETRELEIGYANISTNNFEWNGSTFQIAFNPKYILDGIKSIDELTVQISINENQKPFVMTGKNNKKFKTLILPFKI